MTKKAEKQFREFRRHELAVSIDLAWTSLRTHLADTVRRSGAPLEQGGNPRWEAQCVLEYATIIKTSARELYELSKVDFKEDRESRVEPLNPR